MKPQDKCADRLPTGEQTVTLESSAVNGDDRVLKACLTLLQRSGVPGAEDIPYDRGAVLRFVDEEEIRAKLSEIVG